MHNNMFFLYAALVLLFLILYHYFRQGILDNANNNVFRFFLIACILDILFDISSTYFMAKTDHWSVIIAWTTLTCLYLMQTVLLFSFFNYIETLRLLPEKIYKRNLYIGSIPCSLLLFAILGNIYFKYFFYFDASGVYHRGPGYLIMYIFTLIYMIVSLVHCIIRKKELGDANFTVIIEFVILLIVGLIIQALTGILLIGFSIACGIQLMYSTISNPATHKDTLTGLFDRRSFDEWTHTHISREPLYQFIMIDIFNYKDINKIFGEQMGDDLLINVAKELIKYVKGNRAFRVGSHRFVFILDSSEDIASIALDLKLLFSNSFVLDEEMIPTDTLICTIPWDQSFSTCESLLSYFEYLTTIVPAESSTTIVESSSSTIEDYFYLKEVERFIDVAIKNDLFELAFQPVYSTKLRKFVSIEALSRLTHPQLGIISPALFISLAERNNRILDIGLLQFERLCVFIKNTPEVLNNIENVKYNLSPKELLKPGHVKQLLRIIESNDLPYSVFQFEITETVATKYSRELINSIELLTNSGCGICLDDFGTGFANLNTILKLPFNVIKLDRSLLFGITNDEQIALFYKRMVSLLNAMGYDIVSEGVETEEEMNLLTEWDVNYIQGYYFSRPLPAADLISKLNNGA